MILLFVALFATAGELKIAAYNVENLFDGVTQGSEYGDFKGGAWNAVKYEKKRKAVASVIKELNADVICLTEIENESVLSALAKETDYKYFKFETLDSRSPVGLGFLSRLPLLNIQKIIVPNVKTRPILRVSVDFEGERITFFGAHFPAMKNPPAHRSAAAHTMKKAVKGVKHAVILGDLNSAYGYGFLLGDLEERGFFGSKAEFKDLWSTLEGCSFSGKKGERQPRDERKKYRERCASHKSGKALDHIMLSADFFGDSNLKYRAGSFAVFGSRENTSDHSPIFAVIEK